MFFSCSPCAGQTWSFSALIFHPLAFLTPLVEPKHPEVLKACCASPVCVSLVHISARTLICVDSCNPGAEQVFVL